MRRIILFLFFTISPLLIFSQSTDDEVYDNEEIANRGYGGPLVHLTFVEGSYGILVGGKGGAVYNGRFSFGGLGMGMANGPTFVTDQVWDNVTEEVEMGLGAGGVYFEYIQSLNDKFQITVPVNLMAGGVSVESVDSDRSESTGIFIIEPGINFQMKLAEYFTPALNVSYRQVVGNSIPGLENSDFSGLNIGLIFKFG